MKALITDDHPLFRAALKQAVGHLFVPTNEAESSDNTKGVCGLLEASNFEDALILLQKNNDIDVLFLDLKMPGKSGLPVLMQLRAEFPNVLIIVVSAEESPLLISKALKLGASAFIPKSTPLDTITFAVNEVLSGNEWLPDELQVESTALSEEDQLLYRIEQLTPHQLKVLAMLADGLLNKQIAYELTISESTVKQHVSACLRKLNVLNRTQAGVIFKQLMSLE